MLMKQRMLQQWFTKVDHSTANSNMVDWSYKDLVKT